MAEKKTIVVLGCGAIGGIYAAHLSQVAEVIGVDTNAEHAAAIARDGLRLTGASEIVAKFPVCTDAAALSGRHVDAVIVLVKSQATQAAFISLKLCLAGRPLLVTLQNGMGNVEVLEALCDWNIAQGVSVEGGRYLGPGEVEHLVHGGDTWLGPVRGSLGDVAWLGDLLNAAGMPTRLAADPRGAVWSKFIFNCVMNPIGAIVLGENRARYQVPEVATVIDQMFAECNAVAQAQGILLGFDPMHIVKSARSGVTPLTRHAGSMATDIAAGRETELEALTGYLVRKAHSLGVPVPVTETVYRLAKGVEYAARLKREGEKQ
ncbi:MAG TPA: 2-dehydropantoate 2-reductase [Burkholderiales bacterium]|nr:2-dehydropantoate 2-reductase [Burkholderiales bacterium]